MTYYLILAEQLSNQSCSKAMDKKNDIVFVPTKSKPSDFVWQSSSYRKPKIFPFLITEYNAEAHKALTLILSIYTSGGTCPFVT